MTFLLNLKRYQKCSYYSHQGLLSVHLQLGSLPNFSFWEAGSQSKTEGSSSHHEGHSVELHWYKTKASVRWEFGQKIPSARTETWSITVAKTHTAWAEDSKVICTAERLLAAWVTAPGKDTFCSRKRTAGNTAEWSKVTASAVTACFVGMQWISHCID